MLLDDDPGSADLRAKVTQAWREFAGSLAETLPTLPPGGQLDLALDPTASGTGDAAYSVNVTVTEDRRLLARAVGNASLPEEFRMNRAAIADMVALGWSPPGVEPGSGDQFGLTTGAGGEPAAAGQLATVLARTLRDVYGAPHPAFLVYLAYDADEEPLPVPPLGT
ncbi:MAG: TY-Chap domain-containing protein, partial [Natronosporangium sp.]